MFTIINRKPCSDYQDYIQAEGVIIDHSFCLTRYESLLREKNFLVFSVGLCQTLICKRDDCLLFIKSDKSFHISQVKTQEILSEIICELADISQKIGGPL